jgi:DNA-binding response OmpR family regulator
VLVVEDDPTVAEVVVSYLRKAEYDVEHAADGESALRRFAAAAHDVVILDRMLPGIDGLEVCRRLRAGSPRQPVPVIMLTALGEVDDRLCGLELGADDYITKPFSPRELVLRTRSVLRRTNGVPAVGTDPVVDGPLRIDVAAHQAWLADESLALTGREFDLLLHLVANPGVAYSRTELLRQVWDWSYGDESTVTVHVRRLREKVEQDPADPQRLMTVWGVGYRWRPWPRADHE